MKNTLLIFISLLFCLGTKAQTKRETVNLQDVWASPKFSAKGVYGIRHMSDGEHFMVRKQTEVLKYAYGKSEAVGTIFKETDAMGAGMKYPMSDYQMSNSGKNLLIETNVKKVYRHSKLATYYVWNFESKKITPIYNEQQVFFATLSPDEKKVAFVFENNLYYQELESGRVEQITHDGSVNQIINGKSDWVYEEEFVLVKAFEWSPNSQKIAFCRFDESYVKQYQIPVYKNGNYPEMYTYKYPKAGESNSMVEVKIFDLATNNSIKAQLIEGEDAYIPRINWATNNSNQLFIQKLNRWQNHLQLFAIDAINGQAKTVWEEKSDTYIDITDDLTFVGNDQFIISSERSGYNHLWLFSTIGKDPKQITKGDYDVTNFYGYDAKTGRLYYQAAKTSAVNRGVYSIKINGKSDKAITDEKGTHEASFSSNFEYFIHTYSNINTPPVITIDKTKGGLIRTLEDNAELKKTWKESGFTDIELMTIPVNGVQLNAWVIKPVDFDENKEYPLLMYCYGGPGSQMVKNTWYTSNKAYFQFLTTKGFIVACVDNRGTGARGAEFKKMTYLNLGKIEAEDQAAAANYFGDLPYIAKKRIGIFGWSYGGYLSTLATAKGGTSFKLAVAVAPVTDWRFYDNIYTERYMRTPAENEDGYNESSVLNYATELRGKKYLLVHGSFDDNVHPQNSFELTERLVANNIEFDSEIYTNKNHSIYGGYTRLHLFNKITNFIIDNL